MWSLYLALHGAKADFEPYTQKYIKCFRQNETKTKEQKDKNGTKRFSERRYQNNASKGNGGDWRLLHARLDSCGSDEWAGGSFVKKRNNKRRVQRWADEGVVERGGGGGLR